MKNNILLLSIVIFLLLPEISFASDCKSPEGIYSSSSFYNPSHYVAGNFFETIALQMSQQSNSVFSPDIEQIINGTELSHASNMPDTNETGETLEAYLNAMEKVKQSIKIRFFDEQLDTGSIGIEDLLKEAMYHVLLAKENNNESRHLLEALGRINKELYEHTNDLAYLKNAVDAFLAADEKGIKHGITTSYYIAEVSEIFSILADLSRLDKYFLQIISLNPENYYVHLYYARALAKLNDSRASEFFEKSVFMRQTGDFQPIVDFAEYLLDKGTNKKALAVLLELGPSEDYAFYPHFLKGLAYEKMGQAKKAKEEYSKYLQFRNINNTPSAEDEISIPLYKGLFRPPMRFKIQDSKSQQDIIFIDENQISSKQILSTADKRATPQCTSTDWACKARYYYGMDY